MTAYLSWIPLGKLGGLSPSAARLALPLTSAQRLMVDGFREALRDSSRLTAGVLAVSGGLREVEKMLATIEVTFGGYAGAAPARAPPLEASPENVSLPALGAAPLAPPRLPADVAAAISEGAFLRPECEWPLRLPRVCWRVSDWEGMATRLWECGLGDFADDVDLPAPSVGGAPVSAGMVGVPKTGSEMLRLIIGRHRQNCLEHRVRDVVRGELLERGFVLDHVAQRDRLFLLPHAS